jgi:hypothetical protein
VQISNKLKVNVSDSAGIYREREEEKHQYISLSRYHLPTYLPVQGRDTTSCLYIEVYEPEPPFMHVTDWG